MYTENAEHGPTLATKAAGAGAGPALAMTAAVLAPARAMRRYESEIWKQRCTWERRALKPLATVKSPHRPVQPQLRVLFYTARALKRHRSVPGHALSLRSAHLRAAR